MSHALIAFKAFKSCLVKERSLNRNKSLKYIRMFKKFGFKI